jgi:flagellar basal body-associated protein FliL
VFLLAKKNKKAKSKKKGQETEVLLNGDPNSNGEVIKYPVIIEEKLKIVLAIILFLLFAVLFVAVMWYFLVQVDTTFTNATNAASSAFFFKNIFINVLK